MKFIVTRIIEVARLTNYVFIINKFPVALSEQHFENVLDSFTASSFEPFDYYCKSHDEKQEAFLFYWAFFQKILQPFDRSLRSKVSMHPIVDSKNALRQVPQGASRVFFIPPLTSQEIGYNGGNLNVVLERIEHDPERFFQYVKLALAFHSPLKRLRYRIVKNC